MTGSGGQMGDGGGGSSTGGGGFFPMGGAHHGTYPFSADLFGSWGGNASRPPF